MRKLNIPALIIASTLYMNSCRCGGSNEIISTTGIEITIPLLSTASGAQPGIEISEITETRKGDRKCMYKDLVTSLENQIITSTVRVYTNRELKLNTVTIPAGSNLLQYKQLSITGYDTAFQNFSHCTIYFGNLIDTNTTKGQYRFYVQGTTDRNITYTDSSDMVIQ